MSPYSLPGTLPITPSRIVNIVTGLTGISLEQMRSKSKKREIVIARHNAMYFIRKKYPKYSTIKIGKFFNRDHATVLNAIQNVNYNHDKELHELTKKVAEEIQRIS